MILLEPNSDLVIPVTAAQWHLTSFPLTLADTLSPHYLWKEHPNHSPTSRPLQEVHRSVILKVCLPGWNFYVTSAGRCSSCLIKLQAVWGGHCTGTRRSAVVLTLSALRGTFGNWFPCRKEHNEALGSLQMLAAISLRPNCPDSGFQDPRWASDRSFCSVCPGAQQIHPSKFDCQYLLIFLWLYLLHFLLIVLPIRFFQTIDISVSFLCFFVLLSRQ